MNDETFTETIDVTAETDLVLQDFHCGCGAGPVGAIGVAAGMMVLTTPLASEHISKCELWKVRTARITVTEP